MMVAVSVPVRVQKMSQLREGSLRGRAGRPIILRAGFWVDFGGGTGAVEEAEGGWREGNLLVFVVILHLIMMMSDPHGLVERKTGRTYRCCS